MNNLNYSKYNKYIDSFINDTNYKLSIEKELSGKNINLLMDTNIFNKSIMFTDNFLNISCNNGLYFFEKNNINIHYNFCSGGNNIFISNYLGYSIYENFMKNINTKIIFLQKNNYTDLLLNNNFNYNKIDKDKYDKIIIHSNNLCKDNLYKNLLSRNFNNNFNNFYLSSFYNYYNKFKINDLNITTFTRTLLILIKLNCTICINGFSCNIIKTNYHSEYYYKYTSNLNTRINTNSIDVKHIKDNEKHYSGIIKDNYVLYYLLKKYPNKIKIDKNIKNTLFKKFDNI